MKARASGKKVVLRFSSQIKGSPTDGLPTRAIPLAFKVVPH